MVRNERNIEGKKERHEFGCRPGKKQYSREWKKEGEQEVLKEGRKEA